MDTSELLLDLYGRIPALAEQAVADLSAEQLHHRPTPTANPVAWLVWHTARVEDHQPAEVGGYDQVWVADKWAGRFGDPVDPDDHGYGHSAEQVAAVRVGDGKDLLTYLNAVHARTAAYLRGLTAADLDRVVDRNWDPPVTLGARLISVADDCLQHLGQAAYARGLLVD